MCVGCLRDLFLYYLTHNLSGQDLWLAVGMGCESQNGTTDLQTQGDYTSPNNGKYILFSNKYGILSRIDHILGHRHKQILTHL